MYKKRFKDKLPYIFTFICLFIVTKSQYYAYKINDTNNLLAILIWLSIAGIYAVYKLLIPENNQEMFEVEGEDIYCPIHLNNIISKVDFSTLIFAFFMYLFSFIYGFLIPFVMLFYYYIIFRLLAYLSYLDDKKDNVY